MSVLVKVIKKFRAVFKEKPVIEPDNFELEHFLLYHGLVGTSPENQRSFKDVKADIKMAVEESSSAQLCIALKVLPLWWEDKLKNIIDSFTDKQAIIEILAPDRLGYTDFNNSIPLFHEDWKVRSNAARLLAYLNAADKAEDVRASLDSIKDGANLSFCHLIYALGDLGGEGAIESISAYLKDGDPWIRTDAIGAYAKLTKDAENKKLVQAILKPSLLFDYQAVQVIKHISLKEFIESNNLETRMAGYKLISGVVHALQATFSTDTTLALYLPELVPVLTKQAEESIEPNLIRALYDLANWFSVNPGIENNQLKSIEKVVRSSEVRDKLAEIVSQFKDPSDIVKANQIEAAIYLVGELQINELASVFSEHIHKDFDHIDVLLDSLSRLTGLDEKSVNRVTELVNELVDLDDRVSQPASDKPVLDDNTAEIKTYWSALKALGSSNSEKARDFLLKACEDYASDKRDQALRSLIENQSESVDSLNDSVKSRLSLALKDISRDVRLTAIEAVGTLNYVDELDEILTYSLSKEVAIANQALNTLSELANNGHRERVSAAVSAKLKSVHNSYFREKLETLLDSI